MSDEQVTKAIVFLRNEAAFREGAVAQCSEPFGGIDDAQELYEQAEMLEAIADHLEATLTDREQAAQDREDAKRWRWLTTAWSNATRQFPLKLFRHAEDTRGTFGGCYEASGNGIWMWELTPEATIDAARAEQERSAR